MRPVLKEWLYIVGLMFGVSIVISAFVVIPLSGLLSVLMVVIGGGLMVGFGWVLQDLCDPDPKRQTKTAETLRFEKQFNALISQNYSADYLRSKRSEVLVLESLSSSCDPELIEVGSDSKGEVEGDPLITLPNIVVCVVLIALIVFLIAIVFKTPPT